MQPRFDSLFARLVLTFVLGMTLTMCVTLLIQFPEREANVFRISALRAAYRVADVLKLMDQLPGAGREQLAAIAAGRGVHTTLGVPPGDAGATEAGSSAAVFHDFLLEDLGRDWKIALVEVSPVQLSPDAANAQPVDAFEFKGEARLSDGSWVAFTLQEPRRLPLWPRRLVTNMFIIVGVLALLSLVAVRWVTRPLHRLAQAAEALGRDIDRPPLAESGPQEVRRAARAFNAMQERLARYIRTRTGILAAMSHDLKTPITRLRLRAELLEQPEMHDKFVRDLSDMENMVNATLGYMKGLDDREALRPVDIRALLDALAADAEELGQPVRVQGEPVGSFLGKPEGLKRCLQNLLDNALRYGRDVELRIEDSSDALTLYVRDRGPGIPEQELERVFEPFYRVEASRNPSTGGSGLGLSIARNLAQSMGGDVTLRNRPGGGLEAKVVLPRAGTSLSAAPVSSGDSLPHPGASAFDTPPT
ncbi:MAG TPA: ATP-binding protein [Burkholderiales bacterium]|nr:ATP-binding protein [Burkholderiales bacterium]